MHIKNLIEHRENDTLLESHMAQSRSILRESCDGLSKDQQRVVQGIYNELRPLIEASLTADQIKQVFGAVEKQAIDAGGSRTLVGKGVDTAKKANDMINDIGKFLQDTAPVKMADQKFAQLKAKVGEKFPDLDKQLTGLGSWMKENPGKSAAVIGVLTALASLAGGPVGGAIAGQVLRGASELIKGEKLSTAIGKGLKTAALGFVTGKAFEVLGKVFSGMRMDSIPIPGAEAAGLEEITFRATRELSGFGQELKQTLQGFGVVGFPEEIQAMDAAIAAIQRGDIGAFDTLKTIANEVNSASYQSAISDILGAARMDQLANDSLLQWINGTAQAAQAIGQGAVAAAGDAKNVGKDKKESYYIQQRPLSEGQVYLLLNKITQHQALTEGPMDLIKKGAKAAIGKVGKGLSFVGKQATEKVTSAKLFAAWKLEGSPTDSEELRKFLTNYGGITPEVIDTVYTQMKLPAAGQEGAVDIETVKQMLTKLPMDSKVKLLKYLTKQPAAAAA